MLQANPFSLAFVVAKLKKQPPTGTIENVCGRVDPAGI
jgi:hypothetical protein